VFLAIGNKELFHSHAISLLYELIARLKICASQANFQQFHDSFNLQDIPFCQCVFLMDLISYDFHGFDNWYTCEEADNIKANESI
jgi:hypothetical protein